MGFAALATALGAALAVAVGGASGRAPEPASLLERNGAQAAALTQARHEIPAEQRVRIRWAAVGTGDRRTMPGADTKIRTLPM